MPKISLQAYEESRCALFALGRNAMYAACRLLKLKPGDEVLTPAFDCDGSLQPFRALDLKLKFFCSDPYNFSARIDDIKKKITPDTKLIHIINHFGMPQPWDELISFRKETGIPILEDNAYSLFSSIGGRPFGTFGDMAIFSLRKNLPLVDGGMLRVNNPDYAPEMPAGKAPFFYASEIMNMLKIVKDSLGLYKIPESVRKIVRKFSPQVSPPPPLYSDSDASYPPWSSRDVMGREFTQDYLRPISGLARVQLSRFSGAEIAGIMAGKRDCYSYLSDRLKDIDKMTVLWPELPPGIVPFSLSILIDSRRDLFFEILRKKYDVMVWPILSKLVLDKLALYPDVKLLGKKLLQINLAADKVCSPGFPGYLERLIKDVATLAVKYGS